MGRLPSDKRTAKVFYLRLLQAAARAANPACVLEALRWLCRNDLFFLLVYVLGRRDIDVPPRDTFNACWGFDRCREVQLAPDGYLDLWAREHFKSSIITFGLTIQEILRNPEVTVAIFSHRREIAQGFLQQIKREFETNELLKALFSDVLYANPKKESPRWTTDSIIVKRSGNPKEATVEAWGLVDNQPTSRHFDLMIYDDVVTRESVSTQEMIEKTTAAWADSLNLSKAGGRVRYVGTRWALQDTYSEIIRRKAAKPRVHPGVLPNGVPQYWDMQEVAAKKEAMGPQTFACQILLNPSAGAEASFRLEWLKFWEPRGLEDLNVYIVVDPAGSKKRGRDYTAMVVFGVGADEVYRVIDMVRDRLSLDERTDMLFSLVRRYRPILVGYEQYSMQADIEHIQYVQNRTGYVFNIVPLSLKVAKAERIAWLMAPWKGGRILLPRSIVRRNWEGVEEDVVKTFVDEEYSIYIPGLPMHDDMLDCLANMFHPDLGVSPPADQATIQREVINSFEPFLEMRNVV